MADASLRQILRSKLHFHGSASPGVSNFSVTSTTHGVCWVTDAQTGDAITKVGFRLGARTPTSGGAQVDYVVGIEGVSASTGFPDGTYKTNGGTDCKVTYTAPATSASDGTWVEATLAAAYIPTNPGERFAITIRTSDGDVAAGNNMSFSTNADGNIGWNNSNYPYAGRLTSGTWSITYSGSSSMPIFGYATASHYYGYPWQSLYAGATASTVGRRIGAVFNLPATMFPTFKIRGFTWVGALAGATGKAPVAGLWNSGGVLQNATLDTDVGRSATATLRQSVFTFDESSLSTLSGGTDYYIGLEVADAVNGAITLNGAQYLNSTVADADSGGGAIMGAATYDGSNWATDYSVRPWIELILDDHTGASVIPWGGLVVANIGTY